VKILLFIKGVGFLNRYVLGQVKHEMNLNKDIVDTPPHILETINQFYMCL